MQSLLHGQPTTHDNHQRILHQLAVIQQTMDQRANSQSPNPKPENNAVFLVGNKETRVLHMWIRGENVPTNAAQKKPCDTCKKRMIQAKNGEKYDEHWYLRFCGNRKKHGVCFISLDLNFDILVGLCSSNYQLDSLRWNR